MQWRFSVGLLVLAAGVVAFAAARAEVRLPALFSDHMVLQSGKPVPVWGWADPGEKVEVGFGGQKKSANAGADGKWMVRLEAMPSSDKPRVLTVGGRALKDVLVGEVWICCGQSNMEMPVGDKYRPKPYPGVMNFREELAKANHPEIRFFRPDHQTSLKPKEDLPCPGWQVCNTESAERFSAVGYFFARHLREQIKVPVGMIQVAKSSTTAEAWTSFEGLRTLPKWKQALEQRSLRRERDETSPVPVPSTNATAYNEDNPPPPPTVEVPFSEPGGLYNGMVAPLIPYAMRGVIFYQGESNAKDPNGYRTLFPAMIRSWRKAWGGGDYPFLFAQLAAYGGKPKVAGEAGGWALLRAAQAAALSEPNTGMAVTIDIGSAGLIHPPNKQEVGRRLGLLAQSIVYGQKVECWGPRFRSMRVAEGKARITFDHVAGGLVVHPIREGKPPVETTELCGFEVAGADGAYRWAEAEVNGEEVIVGSPEVLEPVKVRYAWAGNPDCNLFNKAGLPAEPFRCGEVEKK